MSLAPDTLCTETAANAWHEIARRIVEGESFDGTVWGEIRWMRFQNQIDWSTREYLEDRLWRDFGAEEETPNAPELVALILELTERGYDEPNA